MTIEEFLNSQESLGDEFQKVLDNNRDDLYETTPEITWTNCANEMPPDDETMIICTYADGMIDKMHAMIFHAAVKLSRKANGETYIGWTPYTPEKWKEMNK